MLKLKVRFIFRAGNLLSWKQYTEKFWAFVGLFGNDIRHLGSKSLAAEGLHSSLDLTNQIILMYGIRWSKLNPTPTYPYGYGNARYIASLISGCWLFGFGGGVSLYHGVSGLLHPHEIESPSWASL